MQAADERSLLVGRIGLTDDSGWPLCAAVRPPCIQWSAGGPETARRSDAGQVHRSGT
jgi:hypothetical protein